jgi:hypothetical protein
MADGSHAHQTQDCHGLLDGRFRRPLALFREQRFSLAISLDLMRLRTLQALLPCHREAGTHFRQEQGNDDGSGGRKEGGRPRW